MYVCVYVPGWFRVHTSMYVSVLCLSLSSLSVCLVPLIGKNDQGLQICLLACLRPPRVVSMSAQHLSGGDEFGVRNDKKKFQKATQRRRMLWVKEKGKKMRASCSTTEPTDFHRSRKNRFEISPNHR
jgi:hypothetical protein